MKKVTVSVPATTANLGPGFDCFGIAYELYNSFTFEKSDKFEFTNVPERYMTERNLSVVAFKKAMSTFNPDMNVAFHVTQDEVNVPISRGLGSSSTMILAGVIAFNELYDAKLSKEQILEIATSVEGHPDNVAPALYGGLTCATMDDGIIGVEKYVPAPNLHFTLMVPDFKLSTEKSRSVLPLEVSRQDAIFNISHAALLLTALQSGNAEKISFALKDKIHQPYRKSLIPDYDIVSSKAIECGAFATCLSGAGPTLLAIATDDISHDLELELANCCEANWKVYDLKAASAGVIIK